ncbi:MAG: RNA polymerase subunit sigma [Nannocystaceae bacterium]|nr:RNA polymerase subunit sigma [Nannocystaceae bacterium]
MTREVPNMAAIPVVESGESWATLYAELRAVAHGLMRRERAEHTLQTTALVHEAWLKLGADDLQHRGQFMAAAARAMRCILTDHARGRGRAKRGAGQVASTDVAVVEGGALAIADAYGELVDLLALDAALDQLAKIDELAAQIVELRFFGGLNHDEIASLWNISRRTVDRSFRLARAYLLEAMSAATTGRTV